MIIRSNQTLPDGTAVGAWELVNRSGAGVAVMEWGATLLSVSIPDRQGIIGDVTLAHDRLEDYFRQRQFFGCVVGRYANRLSRASFSVDGQRFTIAPNEGANLLHGGREGFDRRLWRGTIVETCDGEGVRLSLLSPDGDQGFPGEIQAAVTYVWTDDNRLVTEFIATTSKACPLSLTLHGYWNLGGFETEPTIGDHHLTLFAGHYLPRRPDGIPTGCLQAVGDTPFDFRVAQPLSRHFGHPDRKHEEDVGLDHCWSIDGTGLRPAATLYHPQSGREMTIETDQPGIQVYTADHLDATVQRRGGLSCVPRCALALETQQFPDAPNHPSFPDPTLRPGQEWRSRTIYSFSVR